MVKNDSEIINGCVRGRRKDQELLYNKYSSKLYGVCLRYVKNKMEAEDVLQDGFVKIFKNIASYKGMNENSLFFWMRRIMVNTSLNYLRDHKSFRFSIEFNEAEEPEDHEVFEQELLITEENAAKVMDIIRTLPDGYRTVFNLYAIEGFSHDEIAQAMGISVNTSKTQLHKARKTIKMQLQSLLISENSTKIVV